MKGFVLYYNLKIQQLKKYHTYVCFGFLAVLGLYLFRRLFFFNHTLFFRDFYRCVYPAKIQALTLLKKQGLFAWNPYLDGGLPLVADISHFWALYPPNFLFYVFDAVSAFNFLTLLHFIFAGIGIYKLRLFQKECYYGVYVSMIVWVLSGFYLSSINRPSYFFTVSWMPWIAWAWQRIDESHGRSALLLGILSLFQFMAGEVQVVILSQISGFILYMSRAQKPLNVFHLCKILIIVGVICFGVGAVQMLPTLELSSLSTRGHGIPFERLVVNSLHPLQLVTLLLPFPLPLFPSEAGFNGYQVIFESMGIPLFISIHTGAIVFTLLIATLVRSWNREQFLWIAAIFLFLLLSLGKYFPTYFRIVHHFIPFGSSFIFPMKYLLPCQLFISLLAGKCITEQFSSGKGHLTKMVFLSTGVIVLIFGFLLFPDFLTQFEDRLGKFALKKIVSSVQNQCLLTLFFVVTFAIMLTFRHSSWKKKALLRIIFLELLFYAPPIIWTTNSSLFTNPPAFPLLTESGFSSLLPPFRIANFKLNTPPSMTIISGVKGLAERRRWKLLGLNQNTGTMYGLAYAEKYGPQRLQATYKLWTQSGLSKFDIYRLLGTRYYLSSKLMSNQENISLAHKMLSIVYKRLGNKQKSEEHASKANEFKGRVINNFPFSGARGALYL